MKKIICLIVLICFQYHTNAQDKVKGDFIQEFGTTFEVHSLDFKTDTTATFKVIFDVDRSFDPTQPNKLIETAARFLNMHYNAGVPAENMHVALVVHGNAVKDLLQSNYYTKRFEDQEVKTNPNIPLLKALANQNVEIIVCGQSAAHHQVLKEQVQEDVQFALSAMTALIQLQNKNYQLIKF